MNQKSYKVAVHAYPTKIKITLGPYVDEFLVYHPSKDLVTDVSYIMKNRLPRLIGSVTERITTEIISGGMIDIDNEVWNLTSIPLREFEKSHSIRLLPDFGIYCDDVITMASKDKERMIFVTESKGTTLERGFSYNIQAKVWYQLPRTANSISKARESLGSSTKVGGAISVLVNHYQNTILINIVDMTASLVRELPDSWMYKKSSWFEV